MGLILYIRFNDFKMNVLLVFKLKCLFHLFTIDLIKSSNFMFSKYHIFCNGFQHLDYLKELSKFSVQNIIKNYHFQPSCIIKIK